MRRPDSASGTRFAGSPSPRPPPLAPPAPRRIAPLRSSASQLLWRGLTSPARSSSATAPRLPDAIRRRTRAPDGQEISRFPREELEHMPGSLTTPGRNRPRGFATVRIAFQPWNAVGARDDRSFAAQWLACASPCRRFAADLAVDSARLGAGAMRETFTVEDFHLMLLAGLPAHPCWLALSSASVTPSRPCHVSSPRLVERSMRISRTALSCLLRLKAYGAYPAGAAFGAGRTTR